MRQHRTVFYSAALALLAAWLLACPQAAQTAVDIGGLVGCILSHENEPVSQIVTDCAKYGAPTVQDVENVLEQHRAATARERAVGKLPGCDGGVDGGAK